MPEENRATQTERRRNLRYIIGGRAEFQAGPEGAFADLVNVGKYGMLLRSSVMLPEGSELQLLLRVKGYPNEILGQGKVVRANSDLMAVQFCEEPPALPQLLLWLERENVPWVSLDTHANAGWGLEQKTAPPASPSSQSRDEKKELEEIQPFLDSLG